MRHRLDFPRRPDVLRGGSPPELIHKPVDKKPSSPHQMLIVQTFYLKRFTPKQCMKRMPLVHSLDHQLLIYLLCVLVH